MEQWKDIKGYEGYYQVSSLGRVKSLTREIYHNLTNGKAIRKGKLLKLGKNKGYACVFLMKEGVRTWVTVHRLVAQAFIKNLEGRKCVNHKNGLRDDNRLSNLEWVTHKENTKHAIDVTKNFTQHKFSSYSKRRKLKKEQVLFIRSDNNLSIAQLAEKFNMGTTPIERILKRHTYKNI